LSLAFSPHGKLLASGSHDKSIPLWSPMKTEAKKAGLENVLELRLDASMNR